MIVPFKVLQRRLAAKRQGKLCKLLFDSSLIVVIATTFSMSVTDVRYVKLAGNEHGFLYSGVGFLWYRG